MSLIYRYQHGTRIGSERRRYNVGTLSDEGSKAVEGKRTHSVDSVVSVLSIQPPNI